MGSDRISIRCGSDQRRARTSFVTFDFLDIRRLPSASIIDLGPLGGGNVTGINSGGNVVGKEAAGGLQGEAILIDSPNVIETLGILPALDSSAATGINAAGQVAGYSFKSGGGGGAIVTPEASLYNNGQLIGLGTLGGSSSKANGINDSGQVVGWADTTSGQDAFIYSNGQMTDLGGLPGASSSTATAINDSGLIVGYSSVGTGGVGGGGLITQNAFILNAGKFSDLTKTQVFSIAYGINNMGQVVGEWDGGGIGDHAFLWSNGAMTDLGTLPGDASSIAEGINDSGQVVGYATNGVGDSILDRAFLYENGTLTDLNSLLPANSGWVLNSATAINNAGEIVGMGKLNGLVHAYILYTSSPTPTPTPSPTPTPTPTSAPTSTPTATSTPTSSIKGKRTPIVAPAPAPPPTRAPRRLSVHPTTPPRIIGLKESVGRHGTQTLVIKLDQAIIARPARSTSSYSFLGAGLDGVLGTADDFAVPITRSIYNARSHTISLVVAQHPRPTGLVQLVVNAKAIVNSLGQELDGKNDGVPGSGFVSTLTLR